jgi:hypothetical protein
MTHKQKIFFSLLFIAALCLVAIAFLTPPSIVEEVQQPRVLSEHVTIPDTKKVVASEARTVLKGEYDVPLNPKNDSEKVIVPNAVLTLKGSYDTAQVNAKTWSDDAKLMYARSLGILTVSGKSGTWQIAFGSKKKKSGYEVIVQGGALLSGKEVESDSSGYGLPANWYDSDEAIATIAAFPQFKDATVSSISMYYNLDGKRWGYVLGTSRGATSLLIK